MTSCLQHEQLQYVDGLAVARMGAGVESACGQQGSALVDRHVKRAAHRRSARRARLALCAYQLTMIEAEANLVMARLMRETADLIERGLIRRWEVDIEFGHEARPDPRTGGFTMEMISTGERTVTIKLHGNDFQQADWENAARDRGQRALGREPKPLTRGRTNE